jgi:hypothetical protein
MAYFPIRLAFANELKHFGRESVGLNALTGLPSEHHAPLARGRNTRAHALA